MPILIADTKRILYMHVPKTGGTSIERLLASYGEVTLRADRTPTALKCTPQHLHTESLLGLFRSPNPRWSMEFDYVFMTVRNPLRRLISEYNYQHMYNSPFKARRNAFSRMLGIDPWIHYSYFQWRRNPFYADNHFRPQVEFQLPGAEVFKLEDGLDPVRLRLDALLERRGDSLAHHMTSPASKFSQQLSSASRRLIMNWYGDDFARFSYPDPW